MGQTGTFAPNIFLIPEFDATNQTIPSGDAAIRVVNLSPGVQSANLFGSLGGGAATAVDNGTSNVTYWSNTSAGDYTMVPVSSLGTLSVRSGADLNTDLTLASNSNLSNFVFQAGHAYTIYLYGQTGVGTQGLTAYVTQDWPLT